MLKAYVLKRKEVVSGTITEAKDPRVVSWMHAVRPNKKEVQEISAKLNIPPSELSICLDRKERARIEQRASYSIVILKTPLESKKFVLTTTLSLFISKGFVLSMLSEPTPAFEEFIKDKAAMKNIFSQGQDNLVYALVSLLTKNFSRGLESLEDSIDLLETRIVSKGTGEQLEETLNLKKSILYLRKGIHDNQSVLDGLQQGYVKEIRNKKLFHQAFIEQLQLIDVVTVLGERITSTTELSLNSISHRLNVVMKYFTILASVLLLPTLISGIYGMNFQFIPLAQHPLGFWITVGIMLGVVIVALLLFKKAKWL